jgi:thiol-disulfide isomerase/thioredoxin
MPIARAVETWIGRAWRRAPGGVAVLAVAILAVTAVVAVPGAFAATPTTGATATGTPLGGNTSSGEVPIGQVLRDAPLQPLNGPPRTLSAYRGRPLLINVWASWCGPCRQEMASLERLAWHDAARGFDILGISTDDDADAARAWLRATNATLSHFIDSRLRLETMLGASRLPLTVLVAADGRVLAKFYGAREWDSAESRTLIAATFARAAGPSARPAPAPARATPR